MKLTMGPRLVTPEEAGMPPMPGYLVLMARARCERGCVGTMRQPVPHELISDASAFYGFSDGMSREFLDSHVCLRKALVGDRHWCAACGWWDVVEQRGFLRQHLRSVRGRVVETERCPGSDMEPGRRVA